MQAECEIGKPGDVKNVDSKQRTVFFISDNTGVTAEALGMSLLSQFESIDFKPILLSFVKTPESARKAVARINREALRSGQRPIVFDTVVKPEIREIISSSQALVMDFLKTFIGPLEEELQVQSSYSVGKLRKIDDRERYDARMEAVNFALAHDDGLAVKGYFNADLILIGVSRCGKTPTSLYMALQFGLKVANYPLTEEEVGETRLPKALRPHKEKIFGLTINPDRLHEIRTARRADSDYASHRRCRKEVEGVEAVYRGEGITCINTTSRSIEEISAKIVAAAGIRRQHL